MTYPIEIAKAASPNLADFEWVLLYPAADSPVFQLTINEKGKTENLFYRNIGLNWLVAESGELLDGWFYDKEGENPQSLESATPTGDEIRFVLFVWLHSDKGEYMGITDMELCGDCDNLTFWCAGKHVNCTNCEELALSIEALITSVQMDYERKEEYIICKVCIASGFGVSDFNNITMCRGCREWCSWDFVQTLELIGTSQRTSCFNCTDEYYFCEGCQRYGSREFFVEDPDTGDLIFCIGCAENETHMGGLINEWNYRPSFVFHPPLPEDPFKPLYIGVEFELNWEGYITDARDWIKGLNQFGDLLYAKEDSSIDEGFEVCSMPMSPNWAMENFPFEYFTEAIDLGADEKHQSTGMHIHMDRTAFTTAQMWKFLQVHKKLSQLCGMAGGRGTESGYASFTENTKHLETNLMYIARTKGQAYANPERYTAVNLINDNTIELRYMEGGISSDNIKKNIQWVKALYDFTDHIDIADVKAGVLDDYGYLLGWISDEVKYPALAKFVKINTWMTAKMPERIVV